MWCLGLCKPGVLLILGFWVVFLSRGGVFLILDNFVVLILNLLDWWVFGNFVFSEGLVLLILVFFGWLLRRLFVVWGFSGNWRFGDLFCFG